MQILIFDAIEKKTDSSNPINNFKISKLGRTLRYLKIPIKICTTYSPSIKIALNWLVNENKSIIPENLRNKKDLKIINEHFGNYLNASY